MRKSMSITLKEIWGRMRLHNFSKLTNLLEGYFEIYNKAGSENYRRPIQQGQKISIMPGYRSVELHAEKWKRF